MTQQKATNSVLQVLVDQALAGTRLDKLVIDAAHGRLSRARARELFDHGAVRIGSAVAQKGWVAREGQTITIELGEDQTATVTGVADAPLQVCLERGDIVIVCKPAGQATAPLRPQETSTLVNALLGHYPEMVSVGRPPLEPGIVHRLDSGTSGLVLAARTQLAFDAATAALRSGQLHKEYLLICPAEGLAETGQICIPLCSHPKDSRRVLACVHPDDVRRNNPKPATTDYRVLSIHGTWAVVKAAAPKAARHQLRAHFAAIGHPLAGDELYGGDMSLIKRQALHASQMMFPGSKELPAFCVDSAIPADMQVLVG